MPTNFDEMDIEPKSDPSAVRIALSFPADSSTKKDKSDDEELQSQLLLRTVPLNDGCIGYVFTCTKNGPLATWRCHACNFVDTWKSLLKHIDTKWHQDTIPDISKGQPLPPGMEDIIAGPCQILKTLEVYEQPLIGLEFLLELNMVDLKEPRYLCLLCDKRGDPRSILVHLTSQSHYLMYLRKYFRKFYSLIDKLPKSNECRGNVSTVTSHLIAKLEEKYGRLQPTATREDVINVPEQRMIILQKIDNSVHFSESPEDAFLEEMLTIEYVQNTSLLLKNFPLKPKLADEKLNENSTKILFNKSSKVGNKKQLRHREPHEESPDVVFIGAEKPSSNKSDRRLRSRETSPSFSFHKSKSPERGRHRYVSPLYRRSSRYHYSRSRSPRRYRSRSPMYDRGREKYYRRSPLYSRNNSRHSYRHRSPERYNRHSPSPGIRNIYPPKYHDRSRSSSFKSKERSPHYRLPKTRSRSPNKPHHNLETNRAILSGINYSIITMNKEKERYESNAKFEYMKELKELEEKLNNDMERYSETPEDHPSYQDEWKKFWSAKFKELQNEGKRDPHTYDYKPEWISFWHVRVKELHEEDLNLRKKALKMKYEISEEEEKPNKCKNDDTVKINAHIEEEKKPVIDIKTMWKELTGFEIKEEPTKRKSLSPWEEDIDDDDDSEIEPPKKKSPKNSENILNEAGAQPISPEPLSSISDAESKDKTPEHRSHSHSKSFSRSRSRSHSGPRSYSKDRMYKDDYRKPNKKIHFENPLNIITVLRQLSVLEFQLGSYASHVISLLSSGLAMEKIKPQSSIDLLTKENVIFLELVKEKLKGQLLAGVVQKSMVKATLFCIKNIEELLLLVPKLKPTIPPPVPAPPPGLLYGAAVESMSQSISAASASLPYGAHVYGAYSLPSSSSYKAIPSSYKHYERNDKYKDHYPFRNSPPPARKRPTPDRYRRSPERFIFKNKLTFEDTVKEKQITPSIEEEIPIDKKLIAIQIAEVLTAQGRSDVSNEELQTLINTVVENLKEEQRNKNFCKDDINLKEPNIPAASVGSSVSNLNYNVPTIPAGFNLNDVSSSTLALLQDAYVSSLNANRPFCIETLSESELIQLLRNFKNIPRIKQEKLIEYLRKLEDTNPDRVEELKKL
ncbi:hypothetical protein PGB90_000187 [Kerria lacca]